MPSAQYTTGVEIPQRHTVRYRVRFDEAGADGNLRPSGLLRYAQDLAWQHSEAAGFDRDWYASRGTYWLVRLAALRIAADVPYGASLDSSTEVTGWRRVWARRHTVFRLDDGTVAADADTDWVLLTTEGRPARIPDEISRHFAPDAIYRPDSVRLSQKPPACDRIEVTVRAADVDPLGHLNNAAYLDVIDEAVAQLDGVRQKPSHYRIEYVRPALPATVLTVSVWQPETDVLACQMTDADGGELSRALVTSA